MDSQAYDEIKEEIQCLESKKSQHGWTQKDADRYHYLKKYVDRE